jgi:NADPH:quinone reductase
MRALVATADAGRPVEFADVPEPTPASDEAVIAVGVFGLNRGELSLLAGRPPGWHPGQDVAGVVGVAAADGSGPKAGARVVGLVDQAGWAEYVAVPTRRLAELPDSVTLEQAATLPVAGLTALRALRVGGSLLGKRVLITGASGGVGTLAVQLAVHAGAVVAGLVAHDDRVSSVAQLGASPVFTSPEAVSGAYDLVLESVGGDTLAAAIAHVADDGTIVVFGYSSGQPTSISFPQLAHHARSRIYTFRVYATEEVDPISFGEDLGLLASLVGSGHLVPQVGASASWKDFGADTLSALRERHFLGKAIFVVE